MSYRPPKGVRPPQFEGKRTGRPKKADDLDRALLDCLWGFWNTDDPNANPPTGAARLWRDLAIWDRDALAGFLAQWRRLEVSPKPRVPLV